MSCRQTGATHKAFSIWCTRFFLPLQPPTAVPELLSLTPCFCSPQATPQTRSCSDVPGFVLLLLRNPVLLYIYIVWHVLSCDVPSEFLPWHMSCCIWDCKHLSYHMTLDKSNHPDPWYVVSSCHQDLQTVTGPQMPLQLTFQLPALQFSFHL